jgi:hypothetical protein
MGGIYKALTWSKLVVYGSINKVDSFARICKSSCP